MAESMSLSVGKSVNDDSSSFHIRLGGKLNPKGQRGVTCVWITRNENYFLDRLPEARRHLVGASASCIFGRCLPGECHRMSPSRREIGNEPSLEVRFWIRERAIVHETIFDSFLEKNAKSCKTCESR